MSRVVVPIAPQPITAWQISTATAADVVEALNYAAQLGWTANVTCLMQPNSTTLVWQVNLTCSQTGQRINANNTDWLVSDGRHLDKLTDVEFTATYTAASTS